MNAQNAPSSARFFQINFLTTYAANNLNRDDQSSPKSFLFGSAPRLRLSSQSVKRAWRTSDCLQTAFAGEGGVRSRETWFQIGEEFVAAGYSVADVVAHLLPIREAFVGEAKKASADDAPSTGAEPSDAPADAKKTKGGKKKGEGLDVLKSDLFFFNKADVDFIRATATASLQANGETAGKPFDVKSITAKMVGLPTSGDVAMFGRMVAGNNALTLEGAVQVAHPFTVNKSVVDDDFFTAVDDLPNVDGSAHMGANGFGSGMYYGYVNVDLALLVRNLGGDVEKARTLLTAMVEAIATVAPGGKQNTFAARSYATFLMAEIGSGQPCSYADAYLTPVKAEPLAETAIAAMVAARESIFKAFPSQATTVVMLNRLSGEGTFADITDLIDRALPAHG